MVAAMSSEVRRSCSCERCDNGSVGDLVLFDFGATVGGYCSDMTRTFVLGRTVEWQREVHQAVAAAQEAATAVIAPGVAGSSIESKFLSPGES